MVNGKKTPTMGAGWPRDGGMGVLAEKGELCERVLKDPSGIMSSDPRWPTNDTKTLAILNGLK